MFAKRKGQVLKELYEPDSSTINQERKEAMVPVRTLVLPLTMLVDVLCTSLTMPRHAHRHLCTQYPKELQ